MSDFDVDQFTTSKMGAVRQRTVHYSQIKTAAEAAVSCGSPLLSIAEPLGDRSQLLRVAALVALVAELREYLLAVLRLFQAEHHGAHLLDVRVAHLGRGDHVLDRHGLGLEQDERRGHREGARRDAR